MPTEVGDIGGSRARLPRTGQSIVIPVSTRPAPESPMDRSVNVFGEPLEDCDQDPVTGFFRIYGVLSSRRATDGCRQ